jgi:hypothetical protein
MFHCGVISDKLKKYRKRKENRVVVDVRLGIIYIAAICISMLCKVYKDE